jgi:predicted O-methyltransferase YrrM
MARGTLNLTEELEAYVRRVGVREPEVLARLREETAQLPNAQMQISPEQGAFMEMLVRLIGARRCLEVGTFTGYSSTVVALALPTDGSIVCCDVSTEWTEIARRYWADAGVADKIDLRIGPAVETLKTLQPASFDFAFIDADKPGYDAYYESALRLVRPGGLIAIDNVLWGGRVIDDADQDERTLAIRTLNEKVATDERVDIALLPIGDGMTLARVR